MSKNRDYTPRLVYVPKVGGSGSVDPAEVQKVRFDRKMRQLSRVRDRLWLLSQAAENKGELYAELQAEIRAVDWALVTLEEFRAEIHIEKEN